MKLRYNLDQREFLGEMDALMVSLKRDIAAHQIGLDTSPEAIEERRARVLGGDLRFFAYTYFPHHVFGDESTFQSAFLDRIPKLLALKTGTKEWWRAPRGETKSTLATKISPVFFIVHALLDNSKIRKQYKLPKPARIVDYFVLLGAETSLPAKLIEVVKTELLENGMLKMDFPEVCGRGPVWKIGEFVTRNGVRGEAYGCEQAIRGNFHGSKRPKWALGDDLITEKEAKSPKVCTKRWEYLEQAVEYLGPPDGSMHFTGVGTSITKGDPITRADREPGHLVHTFKAIEVEPQRQDLWAKLGEIVQNQDKPVLVEFAMRGEVAQQKDFPSYKFYLKNKKRMDRGARTSWPSVRSLYTLMQKRYLNPKAFDAEMQQITRSAEDQVFTDIQFWIKQLPSWLAYGGCDPSLGKGVTSDPSGLLAGYFDTTNQRFNVAYAVGKRRVQSKLTGDLINMQNLFKMQCIGFENNNAYEVYRTTLMADASRKQVQLPLFGITNNLGAEVLIDSLETFVTSGFITISRECQQLKTMLEEWPEATSSHHYDLLIALWCAYHVAVRRSRGLPKIFSGTTHSAGIRT